ncbi:hypothetical protein R1flu_024977 [Riccia fluitans]|uniref:SHSP domain-containing protein n=1 Tax=Riccia fluitans TaxID=41844 RepID=A0ABD1XWU3_9MARC
MRGRTELQPGRVWQRVRRNHDHQGSLVELRNSRDHAAGSEGGMRRRSNWQHGGGEGNRGETGMVRVGRAEQINREGISLELTGRGGGEDDWNMLDDFDLEVYPKEEVYEPKPPEELLERNPRPAPILLALLIVVWLCLPFIASVIFLIVIIGLVATTEGPYELLSLRSSFSGLATFGESMGLNALYPYIGRNSGLWDVNIVTKLWNQLLESSPALQSIQRDGRAVAATQVDWVETTVAHVFTADMPGLRKEDVRVELEGDSILQISGQRSSDYGDRPETLHRLERSQGRFLRRFQVPPNTQLEDVQAKVENGVLTVTVPKREKYPLVIKRSVAIS